MARQTPTSRAPGLAPAAGILVVEGLAAAVLGVSEAISIDSARPIVGVGAALLLLGYAGLLVGVARGVWLGRRWSRGPAFATQLIQLPIAWSFREGPTWWVAALLAVTAVIVLICLILPSSTAVFTRGEDGQDSDTGDLDHPHSER